MDLRAVTAKWIGRRAFALAAGAYALVPVEASQTVAPIRTGAGRNPSPLRVEMRRIGSLRPRSVAEVGDSNWTLGCECLDRDFADFDAYKNYILPLGIREIRLFAGWAKCEKSPGTFDFAWLDRCVDWANANGLNVYMDMSYGNPIYPGAGGAGLSAGIPNTPEGLARWDAWVDRFAAHYKGRVRDYAMWNEPNNKPENTPAMVVDLNVRTARILRKHMPDCRLHGLSLGDANSVDYFSRCMAELRRRDAIGLFETFIYHGYDYNPDCTYSVVEQYKEICAKLAPGAILRQGENGCPSEDDSGFALSHYPWSEYTQAKWDMRRMLGDLGHGVKSTVFTISDLQYGGPHHPRTVQNRKGLLRANMRGEIIQVKKAYYAVQNVVSVFDGAVKRVNPSGFSTVDCCISTYEYTKGGCPLFVYWDHGRASLRRTVVKGSDGSEKVEFRRVIAKPEFVATGKIWSLQGVEYGGIPSDSFETRPGTFEWMGAPLSDPVWLDLLTGDVYEVAPDCQIVHSLGVTFVNLPVYDSPCVLTERKALELCR